MFAYTSHTVLIYLHVILKFVFDILLVVARRVGCSVGGKLYRPSLFSEQVPLFTIN